MPAKLTQRQHIQLTQLRQLELDLRYRQGVKRRLIRDLWASGVTHQEIAKALGVARGTVSSYVKKQIRKGWDGSDRRTAGYRK